MKPSDDEYADAFNDPREFYDEQDYDDALPSGYCKNCGKSCTAILEDHGIGPYEFWGARGVDVQMVAVSPCCGDDVVECQLPCHVPCRFWLDENGEPWTCAYHIPEEKVDGLECEKFEPTE